MEYWKNDIGRLMNDTNVKLTSQCIPDPDGKVRACFDDIGVPVMPSAVFGKLRCIKESDSVCAACSVDASGF
jgi:hypothetical protein